MFRPVRKRRQATPNRASPATAGLPPFTGIRNLCAAVTTLEEAT
jgi:hypothetical protein